ncbi:MAG: hypothetical protein ACKOXK_01325 [Chakrabartia sp.]
MTHWPFIIAAYALTFIGTLAVGLWSYIDMCRAEARVRQIERDA